MSAATDAASCALLPRVLSNSPRRRTKAPRLAGVRTRAARRKLATTARNQVGAMLRPQYSGERNAARKNAAPPK